MSIQEVGIIAALAVTTIGAIFSVYDRFTNPDKKNEKDISNNEGEISLLRQGCEYKHKGLNKEITDINNRFDRMEKNHINHMEIDIRNINLTNTKILTILEAKYQIKIEPNE